jgi:hypothetical protein
MAQKRWKPPQDDAGTTPPPKRSQAGRYGSVKATQRKTDPLKLDMDVVTRRDQVQLVLPKPTTVIALSTEQALSLSLQLRVRAKDLDDNAFVEDEKELMSVVAMHVAEILATRTEPGTFFAEALFDEFAHGLLDNDWFVEKFRERLRSR